MNTNIIATRKQVRPLALLAAASVLALTWATSARALVGVGSVPNMVRIYQFVAAASVGPDIPLPVSNGTLVVSGSCRSAGSRGTGFAHLTFHTAAPAQYTWAGVHANGTLAAGTAGGPAVDIVSIASPAGAVEIESGGALGTIHVDNNTAAAKSVVLEMIY